MSEPNGSRVQQLKIMILARTIEERLSALYRQGGIPGSVFVGRGHEALSAAMGMALRPGDVFAPLIRDMAGRLAFGEELVDVARTCIGKRTGPMRGRDGNVHRGIIAKGQLPMISHLGAMVGVVAGCIWARRLKGELRDQIGMVSIGEGATSAGASHEALNTIGIERLPVVTVIADNCYAYSTTCDRSYSCEDLVVRAEGYGMRGHHVDGLDAVACLTVIDDAVARARAGEGPQYVVAKLLRLSGHGEHDDASYIDPALRERYGDPLPQCEQQMIADGLLTEAQIKQFHDTAHARATAAINQAQSEPDPDPESEDWHAYSERWLDQGLARS